MLNLGVLAFAQPWLLAALLTLPPLYLLLRLTPPAPRRVPFPPLAILRRLVTPEETPARTPLWLLILRMLIAALIILALARPILNPTPAIPGDGPLALVIDNGWASAADWDARVGLASDLIEQADRAGREVALLPTAITNQAPGAALTTPREALERLAGLAPSPWNTDRAAAEQALQSLDFDQASVVWLTDGLSVDEEAGDAARTLASRASSLGALSLARPDRADLPLLLRPPVASTRSLQLSVERASPGEELSYAAEALGPTGEVLARAEGSFAQGDRESALELPLPADMINRVARVHLQPDAGLGGIVLLDERWRRRTVGIASTGSLDNAQPLLAEDYYVERALRPYADVRKGEIATLLDTPLSMLILTDRGLLEPDTRNAVEEWVSEGGVLLRFAGPKLAASESPLVPVPLRTGDRQLGGALSWSEPLGLRPFETTSPFAGLPVTDEAVVSRQVLAEPGPAVGAATIAALQDGTPLITAARRDEGWLVLVHTTANTSWTSLPLSGLFVDMLRRLLELGVGTAATGSGTLEPDEILNAEGRLEPAPGGLGTIEAAALETLVPGPDAPPGLWADPDSAGGEAGTARQALNLQQGIERLTPLQLADYATSTRDYGRSAEVDLLPWFLTIALILALVDMIIGMAFRGLLPQRLWAPGTAAALLLLAWPGAAVAQAQDSEIAERTAETRLAYVLTGIRDVDAMSQAGLIGLGEILQRRTSVETGEPIGVTPGVTDLALFPLLYWPVPPEHADLQPSALSDINDYLRQGGLILFDTGDAARMLPGQLGAGPGQRRLRQMLGRLDVPPLREVPPDHVLGRSFYLLNDFPGRYTGQTVWVDNTPDHINDGVAGVVIGGHDWAAAWAVDEFGRPLRPVVPGGERQREMARRFGVNLVMYALTGNYKTDQVHVPALLERLGQ